MDTTTADANPQTIDQSRPQPLTRPVNDRMVAGVAAGLARYLGADVTIIRIVLVVLAFVGGAARRHLPHVRIGLGPIWHHRVRSDT